MRAPADAEIPYNLGRIYYQQGRHAEAADVGVRLERQMHAVVLLVSGAAQAPEAADGVPGR